jgi:hypothetical protein
MLIQINAAGPKKGCPNLFPEDVAVIIGAADAIQLRGDAANILVGNKKTADWQQSAQNDEWGGTWPLARPIHRDIHRLSHRTGGTRSK